MHLTEYGEMCTELGTTLCHQSHHEIEVKRGDLAFMTDAEAEAEAAILLLYLIQ